MIERGRRSAEQLRDRDRRQEDAGAAVDPRVEGDRGQHERHGEREEPEELSADSADAEDDRGDRGTEERRHQSGRRQRPEEWHVERRRERGRGVDAGAEEGGVAEAEVAGVAAEDVPAGRQGDPEEHQIEECLVEGRQPERRHERERDADGDERHHRAEPGRAHNSGRSSKIRIKSVNDTSGAPARRGDGHRQRLARGDEDRGSQQPERVAQPADDHRREHHADPRVDLRGRQRVVERDEEPGDARVRRAEPGQQQRKAAAVDAEGSGHRAVLRARPGGLAEIAPAKPRPGRERQHGRGGEAEEPAQSHEERAHLEGHARIRRLEAAEVGGPEPLDHALEDHGEAEGDDQRGELVDVECQKAHLQRDAGREEAGDDHHERQHRIDARHGRDLVGEVGAQEREGEVREVDHAQQAPGQAESEAEQGVETTGEEPRDERLADQRQAGQVADPGLRFGRARVGRPCRPGGLGSAAAAGSGRAAEAPAAPRACARGCRERA